MLFPNWPMMFVLLLSILSLSTGRILRRRPGGSIITKLINIKPTKSVDQIKAPAPVPVSTVKPTKEQKTTEHTLDSVGSLYEEVSSSVDYQHESPVYIQPYIYTYYPPHSPIYQPTPFTSFKTGLKNLEEKLESNLEKLEDSKVYEKLETKMEKLDEMTPDEKLESLLKKLKENELKEKVESKFEKLQEKKPQEKLVLKFEKLQENEPEVEEPNDMGLKEENVRKNASKNSNNDLHSSLCVKFQNSEAMMKLLKFVEYCTK